MKIKIDSETLGMAERHWGLLNDDVMGMIPEFM
jgi:hypothetical protein